MIRIDDIRQPISADLKAFDEFVKENFIAEGEMLREMLTVGLPMSVIVTLAWAGYCYLKERKTVKA
jgi:hypothetical protein